MRCTAAACDTIRDVVAEVGWKRESERTRAAERVGELQREPAAHALALDDDRLQLAGRERIVAQPLHEVVAERRELGGGEDLQAWDVGHCLRKYASRPRYGEDCGRDDRCVTASCRAYRHRALGRSFAANWRSEILRKHGPATTG